MYTYISYIYIIYVCGVSSSMDHLPMIHKFGVILISLGHPELGGSVLHVIRFVSPACHPMIMSPGCHPMIIINNVSFFIG